MSGTALRPASPAADRLALIVLPLVALFAIHPLIVHGCSCGHDFDFHLLSWMEAANQFSHGNLHPHWAFTPAFNAGEPRFVFYPPLSWVLGALLGLLLTHLPGVSEAAGWTAAPIAFTWLALTLSGLTMHRLARAYSGANVALIAATLYIVNPYMLFTAYERAAYAELLAAAWIPLLLHAVLRERVTVARVALPVALLWLTNAPAAVMGCYTLALLTVVRVAANRGAADPGSGMLSASRIDILGKTAAGTALGLGLAAFYIVPAEVERRFVQIAMATITGMRIDQNFLFEHTGTTPDELLHDQVLHTASWIAIVLLAATSVSLVAAFLRNRRAPSPSSLPIFPFGILTAAIAFALTPLSAPVWRHAPEAAFLQFPWRLLAVLAPVFALALAVAISSPDGPDIERKQARRSFSPVLATVFLLAAALALPAYHLFRQPCDPEDTAAARLALFHSSAGTDPTDEYTPAGADNDALEQNRPPYWLAPDPADGPRAVAPIEQVANGASQEARRGPAPMHLAFAAPHAEFLVLNLRDYPAWHILRNGTLDAARGQRGNQRPDGLIAVPIPAGLSTIDIHYAQMPDQTAGDAVSLLALLVFLLLVFLKARHAKSARRAPVQI